MGAQCSTEAGNKKALLIGINYFGQRGYLPGCHNDVANVKELIMARGFTDTPDLMRELIDHEDTASKDPATEPTRENILEGMYMKKLLFLCHFETHFVIPYRN